MIFLLFFVCKVYFIYGAQKVIRSHGLPLSSRRICVLYRVAVYPANLGAIVAL